MEAPRKHTVRWILGAVVGFALLVAWESGRRGFMPLDHSVAFDGGWRILSGQVPWRDFGAPSFVTPSLVQALFFGLFGVTWWSFLLHAMVANAVFAGLVFGLARRLGLGLGVSGVLGLASSVIFYPPVGLPFADQEAFLFTFLALFVALVARGYDGARDVESDIGPTPRAKLLWAAVPLALLLGFFAKQLPSALAPLPLLWILALPSARPRREAVLGLGAGLLGLFVLGVLLGVGLDLEWQQLRYGLFELPLGEADTRLAYLPKGGRFVKHLFLAGFHQDFLVVWFVHLGALFATLRELGRICSRGFFWEPWLLLLLGESLLLVDSVTMVLTSNQDGAGVPWFFVAAAPILAALVLDTGPRMRRGCARILILICLVDATRFELEVNLTRSVNDMEFALESAPAASALGLDALAPMRWQTPTRHAYSAEEMAALVAALRERDGAFFLVGDSAVLYGLAGKPSLSPALWFHPGVSFPAPGSVAFRAWQLPLVEAIQSGEVARVVEERAGTWIGELRLADFPRVAAAVRARGFVEEDFGAFRVLELATLPE